MAWLTLRRRTPMILERLRRLRVVTHGSFSYELFRDFEFPSMEDLHMSITTIAVGQHESFSAQFSGTTTFTFHLGMFPYRNEPDAVTKLKTMLIKMQGVQNFSCGIGGVWDPTNILKMLTAKSCGLILPKLTNLSLLFLPSNSFGRRFELYDCDALRDLVASRVEGNFANSIEKRLESIKCIIPRDKYEEELKERILTVLEPFMEGGLEVLITSFNFGDELVIGDLREGMDSRNHVSATPRTFQPHLPTHLTAREESTGLQRTPTGSNNKELPLPLFNINMQEDKARRRVRIVDASGMLEERDNGV
ncbi:hypothetical protein BDQ17DRAFT_1426404 [Cyathus striatus]|nr:hypothetical protein BDQ17DRAFT_1426404 [Cyathus striatus]